MTYVIRHFPEIAFYFLKENNNTPLTKAELISKTIAAEESGEIIVDIKTPRKNKAKYSDDWWDDLTSGVTRDASQNAKTNGGRYTPFFAHGGETAEPWSLNFTPREDEDWKQYQQRVRSIPIQKSILSEPKKEYSLTAGSRLLGVIEPNHPDYGVHGHVIYLYTDGVMFRSSNDLGVIDREPDQGPAVMSWAGGKDHIAFVVNHNRYNYHGPATRNRDTYEKDSFYVPSHKHSLVRLSDDEEKFRDLEKALGITKEKLNSYRKGNYDREECFRELDFWKRIVAYEMKPEQEKPNMNGKG